MFDAELTGRKGTGFHKPLETAFSVVFVLSFSALQVMGDSVAFAD